MSEIERRVEKEMLKKLTFVAADALREKKM